jgi:hypothetical protein
MDEPKDRPGAVPQFVWPPQVTAPHQLLPPPPPPEPKKERHGWDAAKLIGLGIFLVTTIFGAGKLVNKLENIDATQKAADEQREHRNRLRDDRDEKLKSAVEGLSARVDDLAEQVKRVRQPRRWRQREAPPVDERP